ncbi:MAG: zinc metallopeptidase [Pirellulales bacterium]|jgi:Zn-dependent membrane protease YugP|nr:zinc metallopeptidase [Rhodopirellula sp.]MCH2369513.1 zinc metallopeptidase [Pirellulales bacterium]|tara:strand:- start:204 stop:917 length:714 start_codon:yes stop_codon:yes gene_type:complete
MFYDFQYMIWVLLPSLLISGFFSIRVKAAFKKYSRVGSMNGYTGAQAARKLLDRAGLHHVDVVQTSGFLSDHYNPMSKQLVLSQDVFQGSSVASIGIAAHEAGHAIQDAENYGPLRMRSSLVPLCTVGNTLGYIVMVLGLVMLYASGGVGIGKYVVYAGCGLFSLVLLFQLVTLPVEFDATRRAKEIVVDAGIIYREERVGMDKVLNAAAMTYVAAMVSTLLTLAYYILRATAASRD